MDINQFFTDIAIRFSSADLLFQYLESIEGGNIKVIRSKNHNHLAIIRYVKGFSHMDHINAHYFRSVVWNTEDNRAVALSPFKSIPLSSFQPKSKLVAEDFWDGTMINMFYDQKTLEWQLATRSNIGASCRFYSQSTFSTLFWDTFREMTQSLSLSLNDFDKEMSYSWVLLHPQNRIVVPVVPMLRLVQAFKIAKDGSLDLNPVLPLSFMRMLTQRLPLEGEAINTKALDELVAANNTSYCQGYVVKDLITGDRWKIRTSVYKMIRELRGNTPRLDYRWLELKQKGELQNYMYHYPEDTQHFDALWNRLKSQTQTLYSWYCNIFKARSVKSADAPKYLRKMLYDMHDHYLNRLKPSGQSLVWAACVQWVNSQDIPRQLFLANFSMLEETKAHQNAFPYEPTDDNLVTETPIAVA